jgi:ABC-type transport system substrate-binding protein
MVLYTSTAGERGMVEMAQVMRERAAPAGIRISIRDVAPDRYWGQVWMVEPFVTSWWNGRLPYEAIAVVYKSDAPWNESSYVNSRVNQLIYQVRGQADLKDRAATFAEIQRILVAEAPRIVPAFRPVLMAMSDDVMGLQAHPQSWPLLHDAWLNRGPMPTPVVASDAGGPAHGESTFARPLHHAPAYTIRRRSALRPRPARPGYGAAWPFGRTLSGISMTQ